MKFTVTHFTHEEADPMSRYYRMLVTIEGHQPARQKTIQADLSEAWGFADFHEYEGIVTTSADNVLCGGETAEEFAERMAQVIWVANDKFCEVQINSTYLDELPYEVHEFDEANYDQLMHEESANGRGGSQLPTSGIVRSSRSW